MLDLLMVLLVIAFFAVSQAIVKGFEKIKG